VKRFFRNNGLSLVFLLLFVIALIGQFFSGHEDNNKERKEHGQRPLSVSEYIYSGHFIQATFENWESEFLQMELQDNIFSAAVCGLNHFRTGKVNSYLCSLS